MQIICQQLFAVAHLCLSVYNIWGSGNCVLDIKQPKIQYIHRLQKFKYFVERISNVIKVFPSVNEEIHN